MDTGGPGESLSLGSGMRGFLSKWPTSPPGVGGKYGSVRESLSVCSLLLEERLENDSYELDNDDMVMGQ